MEDTLWFEYVSVLESYTSSAIDTNSNDKDSVVNKLERLKSLTCRDEYRSAIPVSILSALLHIVQHEKCAEVLLPCLGVLRNCYGKNWDVAPTTWSSILTTTLDSIKNNVSPELPRDEDAAIIRLSLQFVGNLLNNRPSVSALIWSHLQTSFETLLTHRDEKISLYSSFVLYGILRISPDIRGEVTEVKWSCLLARLIDFSRQELNNEFAQFSIQLYFQHHDLIAKVYHQQPLTSKLILLNQMLEFVPSNDFDVLNWQFISQLFVEKSGVILRTCESNAEDLEALEVVYLVELLAKGSSEDPCRTQLLKKDQLDIMAIGMLKSMHSLGKSGSNYFSTAKDYFEPVEEHPCLGLKANLVRLLANLCYRNRAVQDVLRTEDVMATLLECSNLDPRNVLIKEWSVLAIRNVCENNQLNQELIKSYQRLGVANTV